jgi:hypothetical protein
MSYNDKMKIIEKRLILSTTKRSYNDEMMALENRSTFLHMTQEQLDVEFETLSSEIDDLFALLQSKEQKVKIGKKKVFFYHMWSGCQKLHLESKK